jgi:mannose-1-phosphate guanylyltransferase
LSRFDANSRLWSVVLAGGNGTRLRPLVQRIHPDGRPKQFAVLDGSRSLLRRTLDRTALGIPAERTLVVIARAHERFFANEFSGLDIAKVLIQPRDRGTAAGILLPAHWISWLDPDATVAVFPSDHFVAQGAAFMRQIQKVARLAERHPRRIFLVGARPDSPETGYGWIEPGVELGDPDVHLVNRFWEKPSPGIAQECMERGCLWNTFIIVAKVSALVEAGRRALPLLHECLTQVRPFWGTEAEGRCVERAYASMPAADFSDAVLAAFPSLLAVSTLPPLTWSDWGTPERVIETMRHEGLVPNWLEPLAPTA